LRLPRQTLRLVIGVLTGHVCLNRHLSIMGLVKDPLYNQCGMAIESASHFLCQCDKYITLRQKVWEKPYLDPADIDHSTVKDLEKFIKKSRRFTQTLSYQPAITGKLQGMADGPNLRSKPTGRLYLPCLTLELELEVVVGLWAI